ncbi:TonB-dependent receptor domain-containing protein [Acinetobacter sp. YH12086]|uniref:TonB-dependent receptor family protein n=1 Tax=Acinetobacter sp. YH12086 TaxID=2601078 RepID=UPI0015D4177B|nr:TonB-dependent receptor [Acinetobacter sp. YH12086]
MDVPQFSKYNNTSLKLLSLMMLTAMAQYSVADSNVLPEITINVEQSSMDDQIKKALTKVNGATNAIVAADIQDVPKRTNADLFKNQRGIYAASSGNEGVKLSIRGSGINRAPGAHASGLYVTLDDLPFTGPGGTPYELLEPLWVDHIEVLRGANGLTRGALSLGGLINYASPTGKNAAKLSVHHEMGSHGYQKSEINSGQQIGDLDYYLSLTQSDDDGFQDHASSQSKGISANVGYQINPNLDTRFYLRFRETKHQTPGRLTQQQIEQDPKQAVAQNISLNNNRPQPGSLWLANKTNMTLDSGDRLQLGLAYHHYPMDLQEGLYSTDVDYDDISTLFNYRFDRMLWEHESQNTLGFRSTTHLPDGQVVERLRVAQGTYAAGTETRHYTYQGGDYVLHYANALALHPQFWLDSRVALAYTHRESEVTWPVQSHKENIREWNVLPSLGVRYQIQPETQLFANVSRSLEAPHPWALIWGSDQYFPDGSGAATGRQSAPIHLNSQTANTLELGGRGQHALGEWNIAYYYSQVKNELLAVEIQLEPKKIIAESNASDTVHQGLELGLNSSLWQNDTYGQVQLKQAYTLNDFHYKNDAVFGKNELAGIPKHIYQAELKYEHPLGFYTAVNTLYAAKVATDYANSFYAKDWQIWGASFGYIQPQKQYMAWLDFRNIANKKYASTVTPGYNDAGKDPARLTPGEGRAVYAGLTYHFN